MSGNRRKKGSTTVFICIILSSVMALVLMFISVSAIKASSSYGSSVLNLAGRSVLSEFDERLKEQYGLVAFYGNSCEIEDDIEMYAGYSLDNDRFIEIGGIEADLKEYSLLNVDIFREQVTEDGIVSRVNEREPGKVDVSDRKIRSSVILKELPSYGLRLSEPGIKGLKNVIEEHPDGEGLVKKGTKTFLTNEYIMKYFSSGAYDVSDADTFYDGEIEYILEGEYGDEMNLKKVKKDIKELRVMLNMIYLMESEVKKAEALAAAEALTPGPEAIATQAVLLERWADAEAENDIEILMSGGRVPLLKNIDSWKLDIESVINPVDKVIKGEDDGLAYDDYLKVLLCSLEDRTKYLRMMDLIQINLKGTYWDDFSIRDMYTGFSFTASVNGREFEYVETY